MQKHHIKFDESMLQWKKEVILMTVFVEHWYNNVIETTGFQKYQKRY